MEEETVVGIGELTVAHNPKVLAAIGLGSCVAVALYDKEAHIGGLAHIMLPQSKEYSGKVGPERNLNEFTKYADIAIPKMIEDMEKIGASRKNMHAKIAGGAQMFQSIKNDIFSIGIRNSEAVKKVLKENNIPIETEDLGGNNGRSVRFDIATQKMNIKTYKGTKDI